MGGTRPTPPPPVAGRRPCRLVRRALAARVLGGCLLASRAGLLAPGAAGEADPPDVGRTGYYRARLNVSPTLQPFLDHVAPGKDAFPEEKVAQELDERLRDLARILRQEPAGLADALRDLLAPDFEGALEGDEEAVPSAPSLEVRRSVITPSGPRVKDGASFTQDVAAFLADFDDVEVAELLITALEVDRGERPSARTEVRYDVVGPGPGAWRAQRVGRWRMDWLRGPDGSWRMARWNTLDQARSRARAPVFSEATGTAFGKSPSFGAQLATALDPWLATIDSVFMRDSMGHHGVSAGDFDGDGLDDLYVSQPAALPNRLFRNRGDGTFEDVTEVAGLDVLDETAQSLFADVDNDGDQDVVLVASGGLLLFTNDGKGHFAAVPDAFRHQRSLLGTPMAMATADYDRDGFLDLYLCTYSYFIGASEDRSGPPTPYHDARNGPPNVLFRNDGKGRFVDVTVETGLDQNNDRYSFAAAWADYDEDGWPDLLVANDFGRKNLYRNRGMKDGKVTFEDVAATAGVEDHGAGMSAAWLDYDNDGRLDAYTGNMWSAAGGRITAQAGFMPDAPPEVRDLYRRHARGNSLFRNRGDGTFEDVTVAARAEMGRWAWSSDPVDFDGDGFEDLYVVNGMFTREGAEEDLDGFFWRQVAARSPLTRVTGTPYDDAWRSINRLLAHRSQANHHRNVFLRNDGQGGFDDVSGTVGLDLDQDGRSFAVLDHDLDGDPDLAVMAARSAPQLRLFRNDYPDRGAALSVRLTGTRSNRDAIGARVTVVTDRMRRTKVLHAGSGFISQHSKELLFGLGASREVREVRVVWPSGESQVLADVALDRRLHVREGEPPTSEPFRAALSTPSASPERPLPAAAPPPTRWLYEPFTAPDFTLAGLDGAEHTLSGLKGRPALLLFWSTTVPASREALAELARHHASLAGAGAAVLAVSLDGGEDAPAVRAAAGSLAGLRVLLGSDEIGGTYTILNRYIFAGKEDLALPTVFLVDGRGDVVNVYHHPVSAAHVLADLAAIEAPPADRLRRAVPFEGTLYSRPGERNYLQYALELVEQGWEGPALPAFERAAKGDPSAFTLYSLGTLYMKTGQPEKARSAFERALQAKPDFSEASNGLGALLAQSGNVPAAIALFRAALETTPDYPDALNNLGYALLQTGREREAHDLYLKALELQPDFPEAFNNLGIYFARQGDMPTAESYFKQAIAKRPGYGEAGNNLALVLMTHDAADEASAVLTELLDANPAFEATYVTLAKVYLSTDRRREAMQVLERLLQRNPTHPLGLELARELKGP